MYKFNWTCYIRIFKGDGSCKTWGHLVGTFISSYSSQVAKRANLVPGAPDWSRDVWLWSIRMLFWHNTEWQEKLDMGRSPFYQKFRNLRNRIFSQSFRLIRELLSLRNTNHSIENSGRKSNQSEIPGMKFSRIWVFLTRLFSFRDILENDVPFTTGNLRKLNPEFLVEWKAPKINEPR